MSGPSRRQPGIETPCVRICTVDPDSQLCTGCRRSLHEIASWSRLSAAQRRAIMDELPARAADAADA